MKKRTKEEKKELIKDIGKLLIALIELAVIIIVTTLIIHCANDVGLAENAEYETAYIICMPDDHVNIRTRPNTKADTEGWLDPGDTICLDGKKKNGYYHCVLMSNESGSGWVFGGYIVHDRPVRMERTAYVISNVRLAARKYIGGKRMRWLKRDTVVTVYFRTDEWCVTNYGYVMTEFLEFEGV